MPQRARLRQLHEHKQHDRREGGRANQNGKKEIPFKARSTSWKVFEVFQTATRYKKSDENMNIKKYIMCSLGGYLNSLLF